MLAEKPHILVVDDDDRLRSLLKRYLSDNGFLVTAAENAAVAREKIAGFAYDLMVLDIMMPGETGLELARALKPANDIPILLLTAMGEAEDRIAGLEAGAEDYLPKPFEPRELVLRIQRIVERRMQARPKSDAVEFGGYLWDADNSRLTRQGEMIYLTSTEASLLKILVKHAGTPLSREALSGHIGAPGSERTVDVQINRLRKKIEVTPSRPLFIRTIRNAGYAFYTGQE